MDAIKGLSYLCCELKIMNAKNIQVDNSNGCFFIRCYLSSGSNKRVRLDTRQVSPNGSFFWNESFSLDCIGTKQSMDMIIHGTIVLELRWKNSTPALFGGSRLLGGSEVSWRSVFESPNMEMERWVMMKTKNKYVKAPSVRIGMKIDGPNGVGLIERKMKNKWDESCGRCHGEICNSSCIDSELFIIGAALDAF